MKKQYVLICMLMATFQFAQAQFTLDGEFRPRTEYRQGFGSIIPEAADASFGISTRIRLNAGYQVDAYKFYLSFQDVIVWGENRQILPYDQNNSFAVFQAWAEINLGEGFSTKLGRQAISYDDQRIMGGLDWAQQGRNHDAALIKYKKGKFIADFGLAFNQDYSHPTGFVSEGTGYNTAGFFSYKTMQYLYLKQAWESFSGSLLLLNNGFQKFDTNNNPDGVNSIQTLGTHLDYKKNKLGVAANVFYQMGNNVDGAYLLGLDLTYKVSDKVKLGAGLELMSGNDTSTADTEAFFPLYGTNHKFNGFMDYFFVGNHVNSIGLFDVHVIANFKLSETSGLLVKVLNFSGEQDLPSGENGLGTELDLVFSKAFKGYSLKLGYSQMFASDGMYELKGVAENNASDMQNWGWAMLVIKPKFLNGSN
ncbi:alginate export family protein [Wocania ichthyoenteri]|uniref:alginate export family protein n=1 Tax=Wocania ichthyoenteri TaxID=1230531 RepID=UPI00053D7A49|nr:alginate export family protein [Wocania ichthyoenteri]